MRKFCRVDGESSRQRPAVSKDDQAGLHAYILTLVAITRHTDFETHPRPGLSR